MIDMAVELDVRRIEVAHVQYYGWGLANRAALVPTRAQVAAADAVVKEARRRLDGRIVIDYVVPDYYAKRPKPCMGGWARQFLDRNSDGQGTALPRRRFDPRPGIRKHPRAPLGGYLGELGSFQPLPWH